MRLVRDEDPLLPQMAEALREAGTLRRAELAQVVGLDAKGGTFERLLKSALAAGSVVKSGHGTYAAS
jgi:hypothetical protein